MVETEYQKVTRQEIKDRFGPVCEKIQISRLPWRMEQDEKSGDYKIFDKDFRLVADGIGNEGDAIIIVNTVNYLRKDDNSFT